MSSSSLFYVCTFSLGNYTFMYRCRIVDQYCCGHSCCFKQVPPESPHLFSSWSLILVVLIVFGCIIVSFALSSLKQRSDIESWSAFAGSAFNNLATTITGRHGIIQPKVHYQKRPKQRGEEGGTEGGGGGGDGRERRRGGGSWGRSRPPEGEEAGGVAAATAKKAKLASIPEVSSSEEPSPSSATPSGSLATPPSTSSSSSKDRRRDISTVSGAVKYSQGPEKSGVRGGSDAGAGGGEDNDGRKNSMVTREWVEIQLSPLNPAYKSSWSGNAAEVRLAASTQVFFPPGFINS